MRRVAAHYIFYKKLLPLHYIEIDDYGIFSGVYPLNGETAGTEFFDGIVFPIPVDIDVVFEIKSLEDLKNAGLTDNITPGCKVSLFRLLNPSPEFTTNNGGCNGNIERL